MALHGPPAKSHELRVIEGNRAHRPLPPPRTNRSESTTPIERPAGMSAGAKRVWEDYIERLEPMRILRPIDGFALARMCEDIATLNELTRGARRYARQLSKQTKLAKDGQPTGGALADLAMTPEGRRLSSTISALAARIKRDELAFGLTPASSSRLADLFVMAPLAGDASDDPAERALCGE